MKCPYCGYIESKVVNSRATEDNEKIRRRRECLKCQERFTTYETIETTPIIVIKKDGSREIFNEDKLLKGILKSCEKRPIKITKLENIVSEIKKQLQNSMEKEISSLDIGNLVMEKLKKIDSVAYIRFASVYRQFSDTGQFMDELLKMIHDNKEENKREEQK